MRKNLFDFIHQIAPIAESHGVFLAIHPDDPPITLLGKAILIRLLVMDYS